MKEKLIIDEKVCLKHKLTLQELLMVLSIRAGNTKGCIDNLIKREVLVIDEGQYKVTQRWNDEVEDILCDSSQYISENRLMELAEKIQAIFPSGFHQRNGKGTKHYFKDSRKGIAQALKRFINYYGDFPDEEILEATRKYIADCRGDYSYLRVASHFVIRDDRNTGGDISSDLIRILENKESEGEVGSINDDSWLMTSRN